MMRGVAFGLLASLSVWATLASATAPDRSLRPELRAQTVAADPVVEAAVAAAISAVRPLRRPVSEQANVMQASMPLPSTGPDVSLFPPVRPKAATQAFLFKKRKERRAAKRGAVCGDLEIQGEKVGDVPGRIRGCGVRDAVKVKSVSGVRLSTPATMDCTTAHALKNWVDTGLKPAFRRRGPVVEMRVAAHYTCRTRNNQRGGKISEHGKGKAIDLSAFTMMDGEVVSVLSGWGSGTTARPLRKAWKAACGPFGTVLGPNSDRFHRDHFHFDTARHRGGPFCR